MTARHSLRMPAINSARGIGCKVVNIHPENISKAVPHLIMGLLWQIIRVRPSDRRTASVIETFPLEWLDSIDEWNQFEASSRPRASPARWRKSWRFTETLSGRTAFTLVQLSTETFAVSRQACGQFQWWYQGKWPFVRWFSLHQTLFPLRIPKRIRTCWMSLLQRVPNHLLDWIHWRYVSSTTICSSIALSFWTV